MSKESNWENIKKELRTRGLNDYFYMHFNDRESWFFIDESIDQNLSRYYLGRSGVFSINEINYFVTELIRDLLEEKLLLFDILSDELVGQEVISDVYNTFYDLINIDLVSVRLENEVHGSRVGYYNFILNYNGEDVGVSLMGYMKENDINDTDSIIFTRSKVTSFLIDLIKNSLR